MLPIDQPIEVSALPPNLDGERGIQRVNQTRQRTYRQAIECSALDAGN
jgi:hypothetical protein